MLPKTYIAIAVILAAPTMVGCGCGTSLTQIARKLLPHKGSRDGIPAICGTELRWINHIRRQRPERGLKKVSKNKILNENR